MMLRKVKSLVNLLTLLVIICMFLLPFFKKTRKTKRQYNRYYYGDNEELIKRTREGNKNIEIQKVLREPPYGLNISNEHKKENKTVEKIIFIEPYNGNNVLSPKQACAIESAAKLHPERKILVFSRDAKPKFLMINTARASKALREYNNIKYKIVNASLIGQNTPFHHLGKLVVKKSKYNDKHFVDLLKLVLLYKYGGIYIDLDVVVARRLDKLGKNFVGFDDETTVGSSIVAASIDGVGAYFTGTSLRDFSANYNGNEFDFNGRDLIMRTLNKICTTNDTLEMNAETCYDFQIYHPKYFNPIPKDEKERFYKSQGNDLAFPQYAFVYHTWETKETIYSNDLDPRCPFLKLAKKHCPMVYKHCYKSVRFDYSGMDIFTRDY